MASHGDTTVLYTSKIPNEMVVIREAESNPKKATAACLNFLIVTL
jgi:hypothetical protein